MLDHLSRRTLLKGTLATSAGGVVMNWGDLFHGPASLAVSGMALAAGESAPAKKRCILLWMNGGASQFETLDPKPGARTGGTFRPISTNVAGAQICELMPKIAQQMDKLAVIRSMRTSEVDHPGGIYLMHTGYRPTANVRFPEFGAIIAKYNGREGTDLPNFIKVFSQADAGAGFLGPKYQPFGIGAEGSLPPFSSSGQSAEVESRRHQLRTFLEETYIKEHRAETSRMHREAYESSRRLQGVRKVFDIEAEWAKNSDLYGDSMFGRRCLLARRLIEEGVSFVEVSQSSYDSHADNAVWHKALVPPMEHAWAGLLVDLQQRGLLDNTLVVWMGEIGRTPNINNRAGRDHYVRSWSTALAGGGIKGGQVYGESDATGADVKDNPVTEGDFFATIYAALGIDPKKENFAGVRPIPLAPFGSKVVSELLT